jgi:branched-chain amino acid transport system ATP-binding protein
MAQIVEAGLVIALALRNLHKSFGGLSVTSGVDLVVAQGERRLIIGPNGAGKTTLFNLIAGDLRPDRGTIELFGRDITRLPARARAHLGIARTFQIVTLFQQETLLCNVMLSVLGLRPLRWNPFVRFERQETLIEPAREALARVGLAEIADRPLSHTSYGERRRVEIAMALAQHPRVLLLDEPFAGLSAQERRDVFHLLRGIPREITLVMIEHDMDSALDLAERITLLHFGRVVTEGTRSEVVADPRAHEVYLGA